MTGVKKKVIIFGATGGTGVELVKQALSTGYEVSVFTRGKTDSLSVLASEIKFYQGDARDYEAVRRAIVGKDSVLVALGTIPGKKDSVLSISTSNIINAMKKHGVKRLVVETGAGLVEDSNQLPLMWRLTSKLPPMRVMFDDKRAQERVIRQSNLDWVIVRPVNLSNGSLTDSYCVGESIRLKATSKVSRANVADFMVKQIENNYWRHKAVIISS